MTLFKDFLKERAKFYSPPTAGHQTSVSDISPLWVQEIQGMQREWLSTIAWKDADLIENLLKIVDDHLGDRLLPPPEATWERRFEPEVDDGGTLLSWSVNKQKNDAMWMVRFGAINALGIIMNHLGRPIQVIDQSVEPDDSEEQKRTRDSSSSCKPKPDYALLGKQDKVLVQVEAPSIMDLISSAFEFPSRRIFMENNQSLSDRIISKMCLYMVSHGAKWLALTSHHKWVFLRLHSDSEEPYLTYSSVIPQQGDTRPFRALLGIVLAMEFDVDVQSEVTRGEPLQPIVIEDEEEDEDSSPSEDDKQDQSRSCRGSARSTKEDEPVLRSARQPGSPPEQSDLPPGVLVAWSSRVAKYKVCDWFVCDTIIDSDWCPRPTKSKGPVRFRLIRGIGEGMTGVVYEAKLDIDGEGEDPCSRSFALKILETNNPGRVPPLLEGLKTEIATYRAIEQARQEGKIRPDIVPLCYGLFEAKELFVLVTEYGGKGMTDDRWESLPFEDKIEVFKLVLELHEIGIAHCDLGPENFLRCDDGTFKIIDFTQGRFHECKGIRDVSWYLKHGHKIGLDGPCRELHFFWFTFMKQFAPKKKRPNDKPKTRSVV